jgi:hypothetical protein
VLLRGSQAPARARAIIRKIKNDCLPAYIRSALLVLAPFGCDTQRKTVIQSKPLKLHRIHRPHGPVIRRGAMAQRHHDAPARLQ